MRKTLVEQKLTPGRHESNGHRAANAIVEPAEKNRPHAASGKTTAAHATGINIGPSTEDIECPLILHHINARPRGPGANQAFFHDLLMSGGKRVVPLDSLLVVRRGIDAVLT